MLALQIAFGIAAGGLLLVATLAALAEWATRQEMRRRKGQGRWSW